MNPNLSPIKRELLEAQRAAIMELISYHRVGLLLNLALLKVVDLAISGGSHDD